MTTNKRHIPIRTPEEAAAKDEERNVQQAAAGAADGQAGQDAAGQERGSSAEATPILEPESMEALLAERDALVAERDALLAEHQALVAERDALTDSFLRLRAEFDNFRKRMARELAESAARARADVLVELLPVLDNLERALEAAEHHEEGKVIDGVKLTRDMFMDLLRRSGVEEVPGVGARFDPHVHEALAVEPSEHEEGTVIRVFQRGYRHGDRVLRPARVVVSAAAEVGTETPESPAS